VEAGLVCSLGVTFKFRKEMKKNEKLIENKNVNTMLKKKRRGGGIVIPSHERL
jgi:hypothetical protein